MVLGAELFIEIRDGVVALDASPCSRSSTRTNFSFVSSA